MQLEKWERDTETAKYLQQMTGSRTVITPSGTAVSKTNTQRRCGGDFLFKPRMVEMVNVELKEQRWSWHLCSSSARRGFDISGNVLPVRRMETDEAASNFPPIIRKVKSLESV